MTEFQGVFSGRDRRFAIVVSRFNQFITGALLAGARDALLRHEVAEDDIDVAWVPGAFEMPIVARRLARRGNYAAVLCLGAVIRGATPHFDYICAEVSKGIGSVALETDVPVLFGVLTTDTLEQAIERAGSKSGNKGYEVAMAGLEMADLMSNLDT